MPRKRRRNPANELPYNEWIPAHAVMFKDDGSVEVMTEGPAHNRGRRANEKPGLVELINAYNDATDPAAYRSDEEHQIERERARAALGALRRHYVEGVDYKELSNGSLWPISRNRGRRRNF